MALSSNFTSDEVESSLVNDPFRWIKAHGTGSPDSRRPVLCNAGMAFANA
jgi:hypothetical protein